MINRRKCRYCNKIFITKAHPNFLKYVKFCSKYCRETHWKKNNPKQCMMSILRYREKIKRIVKYCRQCKKRITKKSGKQFCKSCRSKRDKIVRQKASQRLVKARAIYKLSKGCVKCGYKRYAEALDFHHLDSNTKTSRISDIRNKELLKCIVICSNCHRHETKLKRRVNGGVINETD